MSIEFHRKTLAEMEAEKGWSTAERKLIAEAKSGEVIISSTRPTKPTDKNRIRAELIRHILLGGCTDCPISGIGPRVVGAYVVGTLDLKMVRTAPALQLESCEIEETPILWDASLYGLSFSDCRIPGLEAHRMETVGPVFLGGETFVSTGPVDLSGAKIGGSISCTGGSFDGQGGPALDMDAVTIGADLYLHDGFTAKGLVNLTRGTITGGLLLNGGGFEGGIYAEALTVGGTLHCHDVIAWSGPFVLTDAHVGRLQDDAQSWTKVERPILDGFRYDRLSGDMTIRQRLDWLARKHDRPLEPAFGEPFDYGGRTWRKPTPFIPSYERGFDPQPYTQLAKVLREQGVTQGAARILEERDRRILRASYHRALSGVDGTWGAGWAAQRAILRRPFDWLFGVLFGYGHRPSRALLWVLGLILCNWLLYAEVWDRGQMAPTSPVVLTSPDWTRHVAFREDGALDTSVNTLALWSQSEAAQDYTTFHAGLYALDLFIPLDALGQEAAWGPSPVRGWLGTVGFWWAPATQLLGWIITAIAAAAVAGIVGKKD